MAGVTDRERELEQEVEVQRAAANAAAELIGVLSRLHKLKVQDSGERIAVEDKEILDRLKESDGGV
jgi:ABC-type enterochelin transport system substrate-binding protein